MVIASLYVTYVVPAQGREAEIEHMNYIKDQFVDFKLAIDSLWINQEDNISISQNIEMGTLGQKTEGQFIFLPLANPIGSDGEMTVSSNLADGTIQLDISGLLKPLTAEEIKSGVRINPDIYRIQNYYEYSSPDIVSNLIPVNIPNDLPFPNDFSINSEMERELFSIEPNTSVSPFGSDWEAIVHLVRVPFFFVPTGNETDFNTSKSPYYLKTDYRFDLVMNLVKNNETLLYPVFQNYTIASAVNRGEKYWINLQDPAYGLDFYGPAIIKINFPDGSTEINRGVLEPYSGISSSQNLSTFIKHVQSSYPNDFITSTNSMGKFSYTGKNYYWVPQEYFYQMGGVFLTQNLTEGSVVKTLPLISLSRSTNNTPSISIVNLHVNSQSPDFPSTVAGSTPVQIVSKITKIKKGIISDIPGNQYFIAPGPENAQSLQITIGSLGSAEALQMWENTFNSIIYEANISSGYNPDWGPKPYKSGDNVIFRIDGPSSTFPDVTVDYTEANVSVVLQPVGWQGS